MTNQKWHNVALALQSGQLFCVSQRLVESCEGLHKRVSSGRPVGELGQVCDRRFLRSTQS